MPKKVDVQPTLGFQRVLQRAVFHVQSSGRKEVTPTNVLVAIFSEKQSQAGYLLGLHDVTRLDVVNFISHGFSRLKESGADSEEQTEPVDGDRAEASALERFTSNLNARAEEGRIDPLIGRELEIERTIQILCRRRKNNPLVRRRSGCRQNRAGRGLARLMYRAAVPEVLRDCTIYALDMGIADRGHQIPRRFRETAQGVSCRAQETARRDSVSLTRFTPSSARVRLRAA